VGTQTYPNIYPPSAAPTATCSASPACNGSYYSGTYSMPAGTYGDVMFSNSDTIQLAAGVYIMNSISVAGGVTVKMPTSGSVIIYIQGTPYAGNTETNPINFSNGTVANAGGIPSNLQIYYAGTGAVGLGGGTAQYGVVYAPNAAVTMNNANALYGAVVANTISFAGGGTVHYDQALSSLMSVSRQLKEEAFSWNSY
jgi:hypothetical protein